MTAEDARANMLEGRRARRDEQYRSIVETIKTASFGDCKECYVASPIDESIQTRLKNDGFTLSDEQRRVKISW